MESVRSPRIRPNLQFSLAGLFAAVAFFTTIGLGASIGIGVMRLLSAASATEALGGTFEQRYLISLAVSCLAVGGIGVVLGLIFARLIARPLRLLMEDMERLQRLDLEKRTPVHSRIGEIMRMRHSLDNLRAGLRSFRKYVPADLVAELFLMRKEAVLGMERREMTVYFCDIADFIALSERISPERLIDELGVYFEGATNAIMQSRGTIDKYIGDMIMAFWGAPMPLPNHGEAACRAALQCQRLVYGLSREWQKKGLPPLRVRAGLHTGEMLVGNMGYPERLSYTVIGDGVNIGSRLEGLNKYYSTEMLITESTYNAARHAIDARFIDVVIVKGRSQGIRIYELAGEKDSLGREWADFTALYHQGMDLYLARQWEAAARAFGEALRKNPGDRPAAIMQQRSNRFSLNPPPADWKGEIVMRDK